MTKKLRLLFVTILAELLPPVVCFLLCLACDGTPNWLSTGLTVICKLEKSVHVKQTFVLVSNTEPLRGDLERLEQNVQIPGGASKTLAYVTT